VWGVWGDGVMGSNVETRCLKRLGVWGEGGDKENKEEITYFLLRVKS